MGWRSGADYTNKSVRRIDEAAAEKAAKRERTMSTVLEAVSLFDTYMGDKRDFNELSGYAGQQGLEWDKKSKSFTGEIGGQAYSVNQADMSAIRDKTKYGEYDFAGITTKDDKVKDLWGDVEAQKVIDERIRVEEHQATHSSVAGALGTNLATGNTGGTSVQGPNFISDDVSSIADYDINADYEDKKTKKIQEEQIADFDASGAKTVEEYINYEDTALLGGTYDAGTGENLTLGENKGAPYLNPLDTAQPSLPSKPESFLPDGPSPHVLAIEDKIIDSEMSHFPQEDTNYVQLPLNEPFDFQASMDERYGTPSNKTPQAVDLMGAIGSDPWKANMQSLNETGQKLGGSDAAKLFEGADYWQGMPGGKEFTDIKKWQDDLFEKTGGYNK